MGKNQQREYNSFSLLRFIAKKWKLLLIVFVAAAVLSFIAASLIRPKYKSTSIIYAPRTNSVAKILLNEENNNERLDVKAYAMEEETEQMMELLNSREIKDAIIQKYHLLNHYELDTNQKYWQSRLYNNLKENYEIKRTKYGAISISFSDWDPKLASDITNEIVNMLDSTKRRIENERAIAAYSILEKQLDSVTTEIKRIDDSIQVIMQHGVFDFESQSERVMQQYAIAVAQGNNAAVQRLDAELQKLSTWGPQSQALRDLQFSFREYQSLCKQKMMDAKVDMDNKLPTKFVVEKAIPADKKFYPKKSIIMTLASVSSVIMTIIILLVVENIKGTSQRRKDEDATDTENL